MKRRWVRFTVAVVVLIVLASWLQAQQPQTTSPCARSEFRLFLPLVGNWDVQWTNRVAPEKYATTRATSRIERDPIGCLLTEHFFGEVNGQPLTTVVLLNFGNAEKLERILIDSGHGQFLSFEGTGHDDMIRFEWQRDLGSRRLMLRHDYRDIRADSFSTEWFLSPDGGTTWDVVEQAKYRRQR